MADTVENHIANLTVNLQGEEALRKYAVEFNKLSSESRKAAQSFDGVAQGARKAQGGMGPVGLIVRNSAAQFQDFAVQVQGGQSALLAFSQQAPQLLSAFGTAGTVLGTVLAIGVAFPALKAVFDATGSSAKPFKDSLEELNDALSKVGDTGKDFNLDNFIEEFNAADKSVQKSMASVLEWQLEVAKIKGDQALKAGASDIVNQIIPSTFSQLVALAKGEWAGDAKAQFNAINGIFDDFAGATNTVADGLKISESAAKDLVLQLKFFKDLSDTEMRRVILLFEKAGNTKFTDLIKSMNDVRDAQIKIRDETKKTEDALKQASSGSIDDGKKSKKEKGEVVFNNEQLAKSEEIIKRLKQEFQLTREQASGVVGNLFHESAGLKTNAQSKDGFGSIGLAQWTFERKKQLQDFAKQAGKSAEDFNVQIDFLVKELNTSEKKAIGRIRNTKGIEDATVAFQDTFERPNKNLAHTDRRTSAAKAAFLGGLTQSEQQKVISDEQAFNDKRIKLRESFEKTIAGLSINKSNLGLSELDRTTSELQAKAYKQMGFELANLTEEEKKYKVEIDAKAALVAKNMLSQKALDEQSKISEKTLKDLNAALSENVLTGDNYSTMLAELDDAYKAGAISIEEFTNASGQLSAKFNENANAVEEFTASLVKQSDELKLIPDKIKAVQDLASKGIISSDVAQTEIINLKQMSGEFDTFSAHAVDFFENKIQSSVNTFVDAMFGAKFSFTEFTESMLKDITKFLLQEQLTSWFKEFAASSTSSTGSGGGGFAGIITGLLGAFGGASANGNVVQNGNYLQAFATGGVVNRPTTFGMAGGKTGLMGEAGPEAIIPLSRDGSGKLGIKAQGGMGGHTINQTIIIQGNADANTMKKAAGQGARDVLGIAGGAQRYR